MDGRERPSAQGGSGMPGWVATRRAFLQRAGLFGLATLVAEAVPLARTLPVAEAVPGHLDATLQAFADTILPGRRAPLTDLGNEIHPRAISGVDERPGAVEADALALYHHPKVGFDTLAPAFLAELTTRSLRRGDDFLGLPFERRVAVCRDGLAFANPTRSVWEAAAAVPFTAFCAAALVPEQTAERACGYRVMGHPGVAPEGYSDFSYGRELARELTADGSLP